MRIKHSLDISGEATWTLRAGDGSVLETGTAKNVVTNWGRKTIYKNGLPGYVFISDDERDAGLKRWVNILRAPPGTPSAVATPTVTNDVPNRTRSYVASFTTPSVSRTIRKVGLTSYNGTGNGSIVNVVSYLSLSTPVTQDPGQIFEVAYRLTISVVERKSLKRWYSAALPVMRIVADNIITNGVYAATSGVSFINHTAGQYFYVDGEAIYTGIQDMSDDWNYSTLTTDVHSLRGTGGGTFLTSGSNNTYKVGCYGMAAATLAGTSGQRGKYQSTRRAWAFMPLANGQGNLSAVFKHIAGETYLFNVSGSIPQSAGNLTVQGPYVPDDQTLPGHRSYRALITAAGGTGSGTEGKYILKTQRQFSYPYQGSDHGVDDATYPRSISLRELVPGAESDTTTQTQNGLLYPRTSIVYDGMGTFWMTSNSNGNGGRLSNWKGGTNEQVFSNVAADATRWYGLANGTATHQPTAATNGAGLVYFATRSLTAGNQKLYVIDNTKPGRNYLRPSGVVSVGSPHTFAVDATDEIHAMFPFTSGDVGRQIRISGSTAGNDGVRTITGFTDAYTVTLDGAAFASETGVSWHWVCVTSRDSTTGLGDNIIALLYDTGNSRLWAFTDTGFQVSTDNGASWSVMINAAQGSLSTSLADQMRKPDGMDCVSAAVLDASGNLYWVDTNNAVNKYVGSGPGGTHTRIALASFPASPNAYNKSNVYGVFYDPQACDMATSEGALWLTQSSGTNRSFWRLKLNSFTAGNMTAYDAGAGSVNSTRVANGVQNVVVDPSGKVYAANSWSKVGWVTWDPSTATWATQDYVGHHDTGDGTMAGIPVSLSGWGAFCVLPDGSYLYQSMNYQVWYLTGHFSSFPVTKFWDDVALVWRPWAGTSAQFNARFGTSNGGYRLLHSTLQPVGDNLKIQFVQNGGVSQPLEYVLNESFTWVGAYGAFRTNMQDLTWAHELNLMPTDYRLETDSRQTAVGRGSVRVYYLGWTAQAAYPVDSLALGVATFPSLDYGGANFGWQPKVEAQMTGRSATVGPIPETTIGYWDKGWIAGIDLGASAEVARLSVSGAYESFDPLSAYSRMGLRWGNNSTMVQARAFYSDDNVTWTEVTAARIQVDGTTGNTLSGYQYVHMESDPALAGTGSYGLSTTKVLFDLQGSGMSALSRTHRYWKIYLVPRDNGANGRAIVFSSIQAEGPTGTFVGLDSSLSVAERTDADFFASRILEAWFIQDRMGVSGKGGVTAVDDGDGNGFTDHVQIASGTFNTGAISSTTDYLAWVDPTTGTYLRPNAGSPVASGQQSMAKIVSVSGSDITVDRKIIPVGLTAADWEVRRAISINVYWPDAGEMGYDKLWGSLSFNDADIGKEFRITRRVVHRIPS